jgi:hypothetical protein
MVFSVLFDPVPASTGTRPRASSTTTRMTFDDSSAVSVAPSPVVPQGTMTSMPPAI